VATSRVVRLAEWAGRYVLRNPEGIERRRINLSFCEETETISPPPPGTSGQSTSPKSVPLAQLSRRSSLRAAQARIQQCIAVHPE
jgi:hypothetical protein